MTWPARCSSGRANHRRCELPGRRRRDGHDVCVFHWLFQRDLPFEGERLLSAAEVNRRHWY